MNIDRTQFLLLAATLAAGGAAGWVARDQDVLGSLATRASIEPIATGEPIPPVEAEAPPVAAPCDDSVGVVESCPPVGPSAEGMCSNIAAKRCADFKTSFKPKVAENAVACIRRLKGAELCDAARANLCGHTALMAACQERPAQASDGGVAPVASPAVTACATIVKSCAANPLSPTAEDCHRTLSGMNDAGRASMVSCMATHCSDRGLFGCEALIDTPHTG